MAARGPSYFCDVIFRFEKYENKNWPNLIILEFSINCSGDWSCAKETDRLIHIINDKYSHRNLEFPAYMILDINNIRSIMQPFEMNRNNTAQDRIDRLNSFNDGSQGFNKGAVARISLWH